MKITLISSPAGDWEGLYIDGVLIEQNHSLSISFVIGAISEIFNYSPSPIDEITFEDKEANQEWLDKIRHLPYELNEVKFE